MKIYNEFGIRPTNSFTSAGSDYYIPNLDTNEKIRKAYKAFEKSYNKTEEEILEINTIFQVIISEENNEQLKSQIGNLVHLYLALYDPYIEDLKRVSLFKSIIEFYENFVVYDADKNKVGVRVNLDDTLFINSGIKIALDTVLSDQVAPNPSRVVNDLRLLGIGVAGLYVNKSGMGNKGWDVRACLVDEDYSGFVHLSQAYTKEVIEDGQNTVYCGDKLTQMMLIPVFHTEYEEVNESTYNKIMEGSERGDNGFGSQDIKH